MASWSQKLQRTSRPVAPLRRLDERTRHQRSWSATQCAPSSKIESKHPMVNKKQLRLYSTVEGWNAKTSIYCSRHAEWFDPENFQVVSRSSWRSLSFCKSASWSCEASRHSSWSNHPRSKRVWEQPSYTPWDQRLHCASTYAKMQTQGSLSFLPGKKAKDPPQVCWSENQGASRTKVVLLNIPPASPVTSNLHHWLRSNWCWATTEDLVATHTNSFGAMSSFSGDFNA